MRERSGSARAASGTARLCAKGQRVEYAIAFGTLGIEAADVRPLDAGVPSVSPRYRRAPAGAGRPGAPSTSRTHRRAKRRPRSTTSRRPEASEKLIATSLPTPSASRIAAAGSRVDDRSAGRDRDHAGRRARQITASAACGREREPEGAEERGAAEGAGRPAREEVEPGDDRVLCVRPAMCAARRARRARAAGGFGRAGGRRARRPPTTSSVQHAMPKTTTTSSGPRSTELLVAVAEIESGSIAIASIMPSETIERAIAPSPTRMPPSLRSTPDLDQVVEAERKDRAARRSGADRCQAPGLIRALVARKQPVPGARTEEEAARGRQAPRLRRATARRGRVASSSVSAGARRGSTRRR